MIPVELWQQLALQTLLEPGQGAGGEAEVDLGSAPRHAGVRVTSEALQLVQWQHAHGFPAGLVHGSSVYICRIKCEKTPTRTPYFIIVVALLASCAVAAVCVIFILKQRE